MYNWPIRKLQRLRSFDYSSEGAYFLTFCVQDRENHLYDIQNGKIILNAYGKIAENEIIKTGEMRAEIIIDTFVVMPNHVHMIVFIVGNNRNDAIVPYDTNPRREQLHCSPHCSPDNCSIRNDAVVPYDTNPRNCTEQLHCSPRPNELIPRMMKWLKSSITRQINAMQTDFVFSWQKSYHDHIIRDEDEMNRIRQYVVDNPLQWEYDENYRE